MSGYRTGDRPEPRAIDGSEPRAIEWMRRGLLPDPLVRFGIRQRLRRRLEKERRGTLEERSLRRAELVALLRQSRIAVETEAANQQHYELPAEFFVRVLGPHLKYSCALWDAEADRAGTAGLERAERLMLEIYAERAGLAPGQTVLDLGCGWGSFSLFAAERYPTSKFVAVSNSHRQRAFIEARQSERGLSNLEVVTEDINGFDPGRSFDRIVSIEMFEHLRNYEELFARISTWLHPEGRLFVHIFTHRDTPYLFETDGDDEWMARNFFTGGIMPSDDLLLHFQERLVLIGHWWVNGRHYEKTANAWLARMDAARSDLEPILEQVYGREQAGVWWVNWRLFFLACAELWGYRDGTEWLVSHYLFARR